MKKYLLTLVALAFVSVNAAGNPFEVNQNIKKIEQEQDVLLGELKEVAVKQEAAEEAAEAAAEAAAAAQIIITATPSQVPLLQASDISPGTHITAMGSDTEGKQELATDILKLANIVVADSLAQCRERGEIATALAEKKIRESDIIELGYVLDSSHPGRTEESQITIADLTGVAVQDIKIATAVCQALATEPQENG